HEACDARDPEDNGFLRVGAGARRPFARGQGLHQAVRVRARVDAGSPIWQMAGLQPRGYCALLRAALARGGNDQVLAPEGPGTGHGLAVFQRTQEGVEGIGVQRPQSSMLLVAVIMGLAVSAPARDVRDPLPQIGPAPDFTLATKEGKRLSLHDLRGKIVAITFLYASCADTCPLLTAKLVGLGPRLAAD